MKNYKLLTKELITDKEKMSMVKLLFKRKQYKAIAYLQRESDNYCRAISFHLVKKKNNKIFKKMLKKNLLSRTCIQYIIQYLPETDNMIGLAHFVKHHNNDENNFSIMLLYACINKNYKMSKYLCSAGAAQTNSMIQQAIFDQAISAEDIDTMDAILKTGFNLSFIKELALVRACFSEKLKSIKFLIEKGVDINIAIKDSFFRTYSDSVKEILSLKLENSAYINLHKQQSDEC